MTEAQGQKVKQVYAPQYVQGLQQQDARQTMIEQLADRHEAWTTINQESAEQIQVQFNNVLNEKYEALDPTFCESKKHDRKVSQFPKNGGFKLLIPLQ